MRGVANVLRTRFVASAPPTQVFRPERPEPRTSALDRAARTLGRRLMGPLRIGGVRRLDIVGLTNEQAGDLSGLSDAGLREESTALRLPLHKRGYEPDLVARAFALVREAAGRAIGMRHFDCQIEGGWVLLNGMVAEMETGEGKTLTATLAAAAAALGGVPVHVVTVNDYLAGRDADWMGPVYQALGLTVGRIVHEVRPENRKAEYDCDVVYCTNKEIVFDYLRDKLAQKERVDPIRLQAEALFSDRARSGRLLLRGLHYAIVDEADSVLIDEARTPLIISGAGRAEHQAFLEEALDLAGRLEAPRHYRIDHGARKVELTDEGSVWLEELTEVLGGPWRGRMRREETVRRALSALHLYQVDKHYLVRDGKVEIVDEFTGRVMPDRSWERGLHQLIEVKEDCQVSQQHETLARISYQRFFRRYLKLAGMTGTASEAAGELSSVYGLHVVRVATNRPIRRQEYPDGLYASLEAKWAAVVDRVAGMHGAGRPVLVGTPSVAESEHLSRMLDGADLPHQVLNAKFDKEEAEIIARAGEPGRITIATNMAGRGTDIKLAAGIADRGGLHVILTERHEARRIDRQLAGRCGRQGDPGSFEIFGSLDDPLLGSGGSHWRAALARRCFGVGLRAWSWVARSALSAAQRRLQRLHARVRRDLLRYDERRGELLSFSGQSE